MPELRFITVGDPHITNNPDSSQANRLRRAVNLINQAYDAGKLDFAVLLGDLSDSCSDVSFTNVRTILNGINSGLRVFYVCGNHDALQSCECTSATQTACANSSCYQDVEWSCKFKSYFGVWPEQQYVFEKLGKKYTIIITGTVQNGGQPYWYFPFDKISESDKNLPLIVFSHSPLKQSPGTPCSPWGQYDGYAFRQNSDSYINKQNFPKLLCCLSGHVHEESKQTIDGVLYVTEGALIDYLKPQFLCQRLHSDHVGYTRINNDNTVEYASIDYQTSDETQATFEDPFSPSLFNLNFDLVTASILGLSIITLILLYTYYDLNVFLPALILLLLLSYEVVT